MTYYFQDDGMEPSAAANYKLSMRPKTLILAVLLIYKIYNIHQNIISRQKTEPVLPFHIVLGQNYESVANVFYFLITMYYIE